MPTCRMAKDKRPLVEALPEKHTGTAHLFDNDVDADGGTQIVAYHGDTDAVRVRAARHLAEHGTIERAPPAAVDEQRKRRVSRRVRHEQIQRLPRRVAIRQSELGAATLKGVKAVSLSVAHPAREYLLVIRHAGAVVIFSFVIDSGHARLPARTAREIAVSLTRWQVAADRPPL